jgi:predicted MFS family arabinose efflux permease
MPAQPAPAAPSAPDRPLPASLLGAAAGAHFADQLALAALPLLAVAVLGADAAGVGLLVAAHGAAWLAVTLPGGVWVDRIGPVRMLARAQAVSAAGWSAAVLAVLAGSGGALAAAAFVASAGMVLFVLAAVPAVREMVAPAELSRANARIELIRALVTLLAPVLAGLLVQRVSAGWAPAAAAVASLMAIACAVRMRATRERPVPDPEAVNVPQPMPMPMPQTATATATAPPRPVREPMVRAIAEGARFVAAHPLLRPIALCAVCFNVGFFVLIAAWVPYALGVIRLDAAGAGLAQSGYGAGLLAGALAAPRLISRASERAVLIGGPASATLAMLLMLAVPGAAAGFAAQALVGFGPMLWQVCRTTLTQRATPPALLGRVGATVQLAVYGVRPLGALAGGTIALHAGPAAAIATAAVCFAASTLVIVLSRAGLEPGPIAGDGARPG